MFQYSQNAERWGPPAAATRPIRIRYAMLMLDHDCEIVGCDEGAVSMFGFDRRSLLGAHVSDLLPEVTWSPQKSGEAEPRCARLKLSRVGLEARRADGTRFPIVVSLLQDSERRTLLLRIRSMEA